MVLGTLVAFVSVGIGAVKLKLVDPLVGLVAVIGCVILASHLDPLVLQLYSVTCPLAFLIYAAYGYKHSKLRHANSTEQSPISTAV